MPLGDFRFCFPCEPCSQELKARLAALNAVTGAQIRANLARRRCEAEMARLGEIDRRVKAQMRAEAHDRIGQSMALAAQIRKAGYTVKRSELPILRQMARDFDDRTFEVFVLAVSSCYTARHETPQSHPCKPLSINDAAPPLPNTPTLTSPVGSWAVSRGVAELAAARRARHRWFIRRPGTLRRA
jgi:hypothetical protein